MSTPVPGPTPGSLIGPYRVVRTLGAGGMGVVLEAVDTQLDRRVALKLISPHLADDPEFRARFVREARAQASLDSPHVVAVYAHGEADGYLYLASQLVPDGDLGAMIRASGAAPPRLAVDLIAQVASGLADAHAAGLVHRDIKPANVLLRRRDGALAAYLTDFGIARRTAGDQQATTRGLTIGTPSYMAPELHTGGEAAPASDVYSLGCLLWATLTGSAPYVGTTDYQVVSAHVTAPVPQLAGTGAWERAVNRVLRTAMAKDPGVRYPSAAALRDELRALAALPAPAAVRPVDGARPPGAPVGRRRTGRYAALGVVGVLLVAAVATAAFVLVGGDDGRRAASGDPSGPTGGHPTAATSDATGLTEEERAAVANIAAVLERDGNLEPEQAACTARELVAGSGIDGLQEDGLLDEDLQLVTGEDGDPDPAVLADIFAITFACVFETATASPTTD